MAAGRPSALRCTQGVVGGLLTLLNQHGAQSAMCMHWHCHSLASKCGDGCGCGSSSLSSASFLCTWQTAALCSHIEWALAGCCIFWVVCTHVNYPSHTSWLSLGSWLLPFNECLHACISHYELLPPLAFPCCRQESWLTNSE